MEKSIILIGLMTIVVFSSVSKCENILECYIFPTGVSSDTYFIEISNTGIVKTTFGNKDISEVKFNEITETKCKILKPEDLKEIKSLAYEIKNIDSIRNNVIKKGGWEIILLIGEKNITIIMETKCICQ